MKQTSFSKPRWPALALALAVASIFADLAGRAAETNALTLEAAIGMALTHNAELRASRGRVEAAAGRAEQARQWTNPELELSVEDVPARRGSFSDSKNLIGLAQTVPWPGKKKLDGQIGATGTRESEAEASLRRVELARDVKTAFFRVLTEERLASVAAELLKFAEAAATTARKRVAAGAAPDQEQLRAEIQSEQARAELAGFERELAGARQDLAALLGRPDWSDAKLAGALAEKPDFSLLENATERWLTNHPSVAAARLACERAELELRRARLEPYPDVRLGVAGGREGREDNALVEFRMSVPLPIVDRSKGRQQEARANVRVAEADVAIAEQRLRRAWAGASQRFRTAADQASAYRDRIVPKATEALRLVQIGFEQGKLGFIDLLDTQRTTAEVRLAYQRKLFELNSAHAEIESLLDAASLPNKANPPLPQNENHFHEHHPSQP